MQRYFAKEIHRMETRNTNLLWYSIMFIALGVGIYVRFKGIGKWPLTEDEYYIATSVKNILVSGLPKYQYGGYYLRGLLYQYLAAPFLHFFSSDEFYLRVIPAIFNILAMPPLYWIGKRLSGVSGASIVVAIFSLSLWEIEFSRFARMYILFQAVFIWYIVFLVKVLIDKDRKSVNWMYFLSALSIFIYEGSIFLIALNFLPLILNGKNNRKLDVLVSVVLVFFAYLFNTIDFTHLGTPPALPADAIVHVSKGGFIYIPTFLFATLPKTIFWIISFAFLFLLDCFSGVTILKNDVFTIKARICLFFLIILSFFNLFGLLALCGILFILVHWLTWKDFKKHVPWIFLFTIIFNFIYWVGFCFITSEWKQAIVSTTSSTPGKLVFALLNYPHIINNIVLPWARAIPVLSAILFISLCIGIFVLTRSSYESRALGELLFTILLILVSIIGMFNLRYHLTRYTFFLYPIIIVLFVAFSKEIFEFIIRNRQISLLVFASATMFLFSLSEDFELNHLINIDKKEINYRMTYDVSKTYHYYPRIDVKTPAEVINLNSKPDDIIITCMIATDYYLKRLNYFYCDFISGECRNISACEGAYDRWSKAHLIYSEDQLFGLIQKTDKTIWIITQSENYKLRKPNPGEVRIYSKYTRYLFYTSIDGKLNVYRIPPRKTS